MTQEKQTTSMQQPREKRGCMSRGCFTMIVLFSVVIILITYIVYSAYITMYEFTTPQQEAIPEITATNEEFAALKQKIDEFGAAVATEKSLTPLVLSSREINMWIAQNPQWQGQLYITIENSEITAELTMPLREIPGFSGRFVHAYLSLDVSLKNGVLDVRVIAATARGQSFPQWALEEIKKENLASLFLTAAEEKILLKCEKLEVQENFIAITPRAR